MDVDERGEDDGGVDSGLREHTGNELGKLGIAADGLGI